MTRAGIEPATFRSVAQHLNHCATAVPIVEYITLSPPTPLPLDFIVILIFSESKKLRSPFVCSFLQPHVTSILMLHILLRTGTGGGILWTR